MFSRYNILLLCLSFLLISGCFQQEQTSKKSENPQKPTVEQKKDYSQTTQSSKITESEPTIEYDNKTYGFTLRLPASWEGKYVVKKANWDQQAEVIFDFIYKPEKTKLFSIIILNMTQEQWNRDYAGGLWGYLGERNGKVFAYSVPSELPSELNQNKQEKVQALVDLTKMLNVDVPRIVKTFEFAIE